MKQEKQTMTQLKFRIDQLDCTSCAVKMEKAIRNLPEIGDVQLDFATQRLAVSVAQPDRADRIKERIQQAIRSVEATSSLLPDDLTDATPESGATRKVPWLMVTRLLVGAMFFVLPWLISATINTKRLIWFAAWLLLGADVIWTAIRKLLQKQWFDEHFLMSIATIGALALKDFPEAVAVMLFYQTGELLQHMAVDHSRRSIRSLLAIQPDQALRLTDQGTESIHPSEARIGDLILIRPGDRVPLDAIVKEGISELDTAALTGESRPVAVGPGAEIQAGSVNGNGLLTIEVLRLEADSAIKRVLTLVEDAVARKAPAERLITRFAKIYTPVMLALALALAFIPPLLFNGELTTWVYRALILIVIACPCALVLSVPLSYFAAIGRGSSWGILIKGGQYLDRLAEVDGLAWDKTGTLTDGTFQVDQIIARKPGEEKDVLAWAGAVEAASAHPLARSLLAAWQELYPETDNPYRVEQVTNLPGRGLKSVVDGQNVLLGNRQLIADYEIALDLDLPQTEQQDGAGIVLYLAIDGELYGLISLTAHLRPQAPGVISALRRLGIKRHYLLSGDESAATQAIASQAGIDVAAGNLTPADKVQAVEELVKEGKHRGLAFIGDGINDAPALARADVSIAMGGGSDAALESADIVIFNDDLQKLPQAVHLARRTGRIVRQNIALTFGVKLIVVGLAALGFGGIWQAIFADVGVSLLAVFNALRILQKSGHTGS